MKSRYITPNTPFFKRFGSKILIPAGADGVTPFLFYAGGSQFIVFSTSDPTPASVTIDGIELGDDGYNFETYGMMNKEAYYVALEQIPDLPASVIGSIFGNLETGDISAGEHSISVTTADGSELSITFTVE